MGAGGLSVGRQTAEEVTDFHKAMKELRLPLLLSPQGSTAPKPRAKILSSKKQSDCKEGDLSAGSEIKRSASPVRLPSAIEFLGN
jgi:hypothetical protein